MNPRHTKHLPGRKTDISDNKWLVGLLRHGLVKGSFIPPGEGGYGSGIMVPSTQNAR